jgi:nucleoside-diphosphate-sugar epimerase
VSMKKIKTVLVTGGAGYVGAVTVPKLLEAGYDVRVLDLYIYGDGVLSAVQGHPGLKEIKADLRDRAAVDRALDGVDAVIHLACISNDPSYELNPALGKSINYDAFVTLVELSLKHRIQRFVYASSSSVYGVKDEPEVSEDLPLEPLTDYSKYKALCEDHLLEAVKDEFTVLILRPATVCGFSPRLRLDLSVNILTNHAVNKGEITVFGGAQKRPNIHIEDMSDLYVESLRYPHEKIHRRIFNAGYENFTLNEIAAMVQDAVGPHVAIKTVPTDDNRSYHVSSRKILSELGFKPRHSISEAVRDLKRAFDSGQVPDPLTASRYFNIKRMQELDLR